MSALDQLSRAPSVLAGFRCADALGVAARHDGSPKTVRRLVAAAGCADQLAAVAAVHALARVLDPAAHAALARLLAHDALFIREHAAWALGALPPQPDAVPALGLMVTSGGFPGMLAQRTLQRWGALAPEPVAVALIGALGEIADPQARARLVETIGSTPGQRADDLLLGVAKDTSEATAVRAAAVAGIGDRGPNDSLVPLLTQLATGSGSFADTARLAISDLRARPGRHGSPRAGLTIAQLFLHADLDHELRQVGVGDTGGIATVLVRLGDSLVAPGQAAGPVLAPHERKRVHSVVTMSGGRAEGALRCLDGVDSGQHGHHFATVPFLGDSVPAADAWPRRIAAARGIRRILLTAGPIDAIHLRMADVGTLAGAAVARELGIPVVFTLAPDPHALIDSLDSSGALTRECFGTVDEKEHFWFRARLVQRVVAQAAHLVLFPRPHLAEDTRRLLGIDLAGLVGRHSVVAEGIEMRVIERSRVAARSLADGASSVATATTPPTSVGAGIARAFDQLDALLEALPADRRGLPLALSVGRLHRAKGMATLVHAWAGDSGLRTRSNLMVIGGDLEHPSADEHEQLSRIAATLPLADAPRSGLFLAGHRTNDTVAAWLAAARYGRPGLAAAHGVYVCASGKEEFGIALLEAMASGLVVVAPMSGGPATYIEHGVTGFLVDTPDPRALASGITRALDLAADPAGRARAERARKQVTGRYTIEAMAAALSAVYAAVSAARPLPVPPQVLR